MESKMSRKDIREAILSAKPKKEIITLFGQEVELRQPTMGGMFQTQEEGTTAQKSARMLVSYAFIPGTDERVFDPLDVDTIVGLPWGEDLIKAQEAISKLNGIDMKAVQAAAKNSETTLDG
jgi:hypothetical protein